MHEKSLAAAFFSRIGPVGFPRAGVGLVDLHGAVQVS